MWGLLARAFSILSTFAVGWMASDVNNESATTKQMEAAAQGAGNPSGGKGFLDVLLSWISSNKVTFIVISAVVIAFMYFSHKSNQK